MSYRETSTINTVSSGIEINKVLRNTYFLLGLTLAFSALTAVIAMAMNLSPMASIVCFIAGFIMLFVVNKKADSASGIFWVFGFAGAMGASLGPLLNAYAGLANGPSLIMQALGGTAVIFFSLSAYVLTTRKDFSFMGGFLMVGLIVAMVAIIANIFLAIPALSLAISAAVILIMSGFILFDTSRIIHGGETNYIRATVGLYLNIFNIFVHLLSLLGIMGDE
ncbi:MAG: BAX inhibitor protein [Rheinheimera sp.]|uniref:Bax inhibitor-1/YccA family protein n=1 Tax=Arsukibacterium sp. UBA3155 TaxID=1946058 RepID=UPI000C916A07|nr:Bax inhibitor-1/YccA family protein [Arsukibacterium sp. UBA3155]MAD75831.1 BAX inhibitor protein [Rheinheimera sp.]|tara:strand:- start:9634 stop:10299 length:666 start_codon:yes stop_codon:yes gene_type:complete